MQIYYAIKNNKIIHSMNKQLILFILAATAFFTVSAQKEARLLRFPTIHDNQLVFTYAGDLYSVSSQGGVARKITTDDGYEMFARFSPDGKQLAFTAQYDGNTEVYVMPASGGEPVRLTYTATLSRDDISDRMGPNNITLTWKDNEHIVYRSRKQSFNDFKGKLYLVSAKGGLSEELPLPVGGFCSYSPDKTQLAYNQVFRISKRSSSCTCRTTVPPNPSSSRIFLTRIIASFIMSAAVP
jgi:tricorn protease